MSSTQTQILALQNATKGLVAATAGLSKVVAELQKGTELLESQNQAIAEKETQLAGMEKDYAERKRQAEIDLNFSLLENEKAKVAEILAKNGMVSISSESLAGIKSENDSLKKTRENEINEIRKQLKDDYEAKFNSLKQTFELQKRAEIAEIIGKLSSANDKVETLTKSVNTLQNEITEARKAETERVKAMSGKDVVINTGTSK